MVLGLVAACSVEEGPVAGVSANARCNCVGAVAFTCNKSKACPNRLLDAELVVFCCCCCVERRCFSTLNCESRPPWSIIAADTPPPFLALGRRL